jgi:DNA (cytosine-5)-methyltransferase 1
MKQITHTAVKETKRALRIWIEGKKLEACGFNCGANYSIGKNIGQKQFILTLDSNGPRKVTQSGRGEKTRPIIDLHSNEVGDLFSAGDRIEVIFEAGTITIRLHHEDIAQASREADYKARLSGGTLREASMFTGGGISTEAIHTAINDSGKKSELVWIAEAETKYIESAGANCLAIDDDTVFLVGKVEELKAEYFTKCDILSFSLPCAGFSNAGQVKHKQSAEVHSGTALFGVVNAIRNANPAVCVSENVVEAKNSAIYALLKAELERLGYTLFEQVLDSSHTDTLEQRRRYWLVAFSNGIAPSSFALPTVERAGKSVADILEAVISETMWADNDYLKTKAIRDKEAGKGFARQLLTGAEKTVGTIGRFYQKRRSTEPFITRGDGKERLFTVTEHARCKSIPAYLIEGQSASTAHEIMGQSVDFLQPYNLIRELLNSREQVV